MLTFELSPGDRPQLDVVWVNHGSIITMTPLTMAAEDWMEDHIPQAQRIGTTRAAEPRYAEGILIGMQNDGLRV